MRSRISSAFLLIVEMRKNLLPNGLVLLGHTDPIEGLEKLLLFFFCRFLIFGKKETMLPKTSHDRSQKIYNFYPYGMLVTADL